MALKNAMRTAAPAARINQVTVQNIIEECGIVDVRMVTHNDSGNEYLHFIAPDSQYLSVKVGKTVDLQNTGYAERMKELLTNYVVYTGENDHGTWFTFGKVAEMRDTPTVSITSIFSFGKKQQLETA